MRGDCESRGKYEKFFHFSKIPCIVIFCFAAPGDLTVQWRDREVISTCFSVCPDFPDRRGYALIMPNCALLCISFFARSCRFLISVSMYLQCMSKFSIRCGICLKHSVNSLIVLFSFRRVQTFSNSQYGPSGFSGGSTAPIQSVEGDSGCRGQLIDLSYSRFNELHSDFFVAISRVFSRHCGTFRGTSFPVCRRNFRNYGISNIYRGIANGKSGD